MSHDAFRGAYTAFQRWRVALCEAAGGGFCESVGGIFSDEPGWFYWNGMSEWPGFKVLIGHSDSSGEMSPEDAASCADALESLLPKPEEMGEGGGHLARDGGIAAVTRKFIAGCRNAAQLKEPLRFF